MVTTAHRKALSQKKLPLIEKINWSLFGSIALHGAFFAVLLPELGLNSQSNNLNLGDTPIIELNAIEQNRLPNLDNSQRFSNWGNINPSIQLDNGLSPIPIPDLNSLQYPEYNNDFASLPTPPPLPNYSNFDYGPIPNFNVNNIPAPVNLNLPAPPPINLDSLTPPPAFNENFNNITSNNIDEFENLEGRVIDIVPKSPEEEAQIRQAIFEGRENFNIPDARDVFNNRNTENSTIAANPNLLENNQNNLPSDVTSTMETLRENISKTEENTSDEEARKNYVAWLQEVKNPSPKEITISGRYPQDACITKIEGTATYGIKVTPEGAITNPQLIKSSGYPLFNNQAIKEIQAQSFTNSTQSNQPYHVYVKFEYNPEICPSLSVSNAGQIPLSTVPNPSAINPAKSTTQTPINPSTNSQPPESVRETISTPPVVEEKPAPSPEVVTPPPVVEVKPTPSPEVVSPPITEEKPAPSPQKIQPNSESNNNSENINILINKKTPLELELENDSSEN